MTDREYILRLMSYAFIEIRAAGYLRESDTCFALADVFHNVPMQMNTADKGERNYASIIDDIRERCERRKCLRWLEDNTAIIKKNDLD